MLEKGNHSEVLMQVMSKDKEFIYAQGKANLALEGMSLTKEQDAIARGYQTGQLSRTELVKQALQYVNKSR